MSLEQQPERIFILNSLAFQIVSVFYDKDNPIEFDIKKVVDVFGVPSSSVRRTLGELYNAKCITKTKIGWNQTYKITPKNAENFSGIVRVKRYGVKRENVRSKKSYREIQNKAYKKRRELLAIERSRPTSIRDNLCVVCKQYFSWHGLHVHRKYCKKKPLSFGV